MDDSLSTQIESMVSRWESGEPLSVIASDFGIRPRNADSAVRRHLRKNGDVQKSEQRRREAQGCPHVERDRALAIRLDEGEDAVEVAQSFGVSVSTLYRWASPYRKISHMQYPVPSRRLQLGAVPDNAPSGQADEGTGLDDAEPNNAEPSRRDDIFFPAVTLRWLHGQSYAEIAQELSVPVEEVGQAVREYLSLHPHVVRKFMSPPTTVGC